MVAPLPMNLKSYKVTVTMADSTLDRDQSAERGGHQMV